MSDTIIKTGLERELRIVLADGQKTTVTLEPGTDEGRERFPAKLLDLSRSGVKLSVASCIPFGKAVSLNLVIPDLALDLRVSAEVCWMRPAKGDSWFLGCSFQPELPEEVLNTLAAAGHVDRRNEERQRISLMGTAKWKSDDTETPVILQNLSDSGFCMLASSPGKTGDEVYLRLSDGSQKNVPAKTQWIVKVDEGYLVGCAYLGF